jgi:hypothetical protein
MNKLKTKRWLHILGLAIVVGVAIYTGVFAKGVTMGERIAMVAGLAVALLTTLGNVLPKIDAAIDGLPDTDEAPTVKLVPKPPEK